MTKEVAQELIKDAQKYLGYIKTTGRPHPQGGEDIVFSEDQFVDTDENEINGDYRPLAIWEGTEGRWTQDLKDAINYIRNNPAKQKP